MEQPEEAEEQQEEMKEELSSDMVEKIQSMIDAKLSKIDEIVKDGVKQVLSSETPVESVESNFSDNKNGRSLFPSFNNKTRK